MTKEYEYYGVCDKCGVECYSPSQDDKPEKKICPDCGGVFKFKKFKEFTIDDKDKNKRIVTNTKEYNIG